ANRNVRTALNQDLEKLAQRYEAHAEQAKADLASSVQWTFWLLTLVSTTALLLAAGGIVVVRRAVIHPLGQITRVTEQVANGADTIAIPFRDSHDEIGALARSIEVFQRAMRRNNELSSKLSADAAAEAARSRNVE